MPADADAVGCRCGAFEVMERLRAATPQGQTVSIGLATWDAAETAEQLVARADAALYQAKRDGRNRMVVTGAPDQAAEGASYPLRA